MRKINFSKFNRRHATLIGLVAIIAIAGYVNVTYEGDAIQTMSTADNIVETTETKTSAKEDLYTEAVMERDRKRSESMNVYREIIENSEYDKATKENAQTMLTNSAKYITDESTVENILKAKGIEKPVIYVGEDDVTVLVYDVKLTKSQVSQIKDIITEKIKISPEKIKITENN